MNAQANISLGWVLYPSTPEKRALMANWASQIGASEQYIVNNHKPSLLEDEHLGNNLAFEFSAYLQLIDLCKGEGPFVLVNDTLFKNHWQWAWAILVKNVIRLNQKGVVWGDIRQEQGDIAERPNVFLASWIFVIPSRYELDRLRKVLVLILDQPLRTPSTAYEAYLSDWLQPKRWYKGWHGQSDEAAMARKRSAIQWEHALSKALLDGGMQLQSAGQAKPFLYLLVRMHDRLVTRFQAIRTRFF